MVSPFFFCLAIVKVRNVLTALFKELVQGFSVETIPNAFLPYEQIECFLLFVVGRTKNDLWLQALFAGSHFHGTSKFGRYLSIKSNRRRNSFDVIAMPIVCLTSRKLRLSS